MIRGFREGVELRPDGMSRGAENGWSWLQKENNLEEETIEYYPSYLDNGSEPGKRAKGGTRQGGAPNRSLSCHY